MNRAYLTSFPNYENSVEQQKLSHYFHVWSVLLRLRTTRILILNIFGTFSGGELGYIVQLNMPQIPLFRYFIKKLCQLSETPLCLSHGPFQICHQNVPSLISNFLANFCTKWLALRRASYGFLSLIGTYWFVIGGYCLILSVADSHHTTFLVLDLALSIP